MSRPALLICPILVMLLHVRVYAEQSKPTGEPPFHAPQQDRAERVFASAASKVVFLIVRKSGELHASASGIILTPDGYIATNYHILVGGDAVEIRFFPNPEDSETYQSFNGAKLLYADAELDIAILKVTSKSLPFLECPSKMECAPRIGESVYAIGNPKGLTNTISEGIVSALRAGESEDVIQHTAPISPGSSGGALVDSNGDLLGMNSWQLKDAQNLNFAISAKHILEALALARHVTSALNFPQGTEIEDTSSTEDRAWQAFQSKDYIQAANQAERAVANGLSNPKIYLILGKADIELGKELEAERFLRQAVLLEGPDDKFKQTSRLYLLQILGDRFIATPASVDRPAFIRLVNDFLASNSGSIENPSLYSAMRAWAATVPEPVRSIVGEWTEDGTGILFDREVCAPKYTIQASSNGQFKLQFIPDMRSETAAQGVCVLSGYVAPVGEGFAGEIARAVTVGPRFGAAEQKLRIQFNLSSDLMTIEGTITGGEITKSGKAGDSAKKMLSLPPGPTGPWHFTLHRVQ